MRRHTSLPPQLDGDPYPAEAEEERDEEQREGQDTHMHSDKETSSQPPAPPPHLAARFNRCSRPSMSRKSSASSSRRNSLSSLHSGRSNRSSHGGPFSTHVAQHLRRASILDARRAKLAERAAHAEQVRMRAQQAKATPRNGRTPEERTQAAQEAREKHLAQVAASCAEEVKRAKRIAEDMKERKEKEEERMRQELEEKHANAERRRLAFEQQRDQRRRRGSSNSRLTGLPAVQETRVKVPTWKPKNREIAAKVIQKAWREHHLRRIVSVFVSMELDVEHVQAASFENASELLMQDHVVSATERLLRQAHVLDTDEGAAARSASVKTFLSAFLVLCHPQQVLSKNGAQEEDLINKAKVLLMEVQRIISKPATLATYSKSSDVVDSLCQAHVRFQSAFKAWKEGDASFLIEHMLLQFVELDAIWQRVKNDTAGEVANDYHQGIRQNQTMLLVRLKRLAGPERAKQLISEAIRKRRKEDAAKRRALKSTPRSASGPSTENVPVLEQSRKQLTPPVAREPVFSSGDLAQVIAPLPDNRTIIHELALNKEYRIDEEKTRKVRQTIRRSVFNTMRQDLVTGKGDVWILSMAENIRTKVLKTLAPGKGMYNMVSEALDIELIRQQLSAGVFSHERFFSVMATILPKLVSPARDQDVREFAQDDSGDFIERLDKLFRIIDFLSLDFANFMLTMSAPKLLAEAPDYERRCFEEQYGPGTINLPRTKQWWRTAQQNAVADLSRRPASPPSGTLTPPATPPRNTPSPTVAIKPTADRIYTTGLVDVYMGMPTTGLDTSIPETLVLDQARVFEARLTVVRMITTSTILLTAKNALKRDVRTPWRNIANRLWDVSAQALVREPRSAANATIPDLDSMAPSFLSVFESAQLLPPAIKAALSGTIRRVLTEALSLQADDPNAASKEPSHPVMRVLLSKLRTNVLGRLNGGEEERKRKEAAAADALATAGMVEQVERVKSLVEEIQKVKKVDREAHENWLNKIRVEVDAEASNA